FLLHALTVFNFFSVVLFVLLFLRLPTSPLFPYTTLFRRVESSSSLFAVRAGVLWLRLPSRDLTPESLRGSESLRILPSVLPVTSLHETSCGFHRFEPVRWNGVATAPGNVTYPTRNFADRL